MDYAVIIQNLFPTPIGFFNFDDGLTETQQTFLIDQPQILNEGNTSSEDKYILKKRALLNLTMFIEKCLHDYMTVTINPKTDVHLRITQSWLNWSKPGQFHHKHAHPNSFISGCFYVNANKATDKIVFSREEYKQLKFSPVEWNEYNSDSWWFPVGANELILFPSSLTHMVKPVEGTDTRISLAFNTFPVGVLGEDSQLTTLKLGAA